MKLKYILIALAAIFAFEANAQSDAKRIKEIQKDTEHYINAESTDPNEDEAYRNALRQIVDMSRNFVETNSSGRTTISDAAIEKCVGKIVIPRGDFKRVFLFAARTDLLSGGGAAAPAAAQQPSAPAPAREDRAQEKPSTPAAPASEPEQQQAMPTVDDIMTGLFGEDDENESAPVTAPEPQNEESPEEFAAQVPQEIATEVAATNDVPAATRELIGLLQGATSLRQAVSILDKYKNRRVVANYGVARDARNSAQCYWVVEENGTLTVLGPEKRGHRNNFRTGKPDALHRYSRGMWFRKK